MSSRTYDETLSQAECLLSEYKNISSTREKIRRMQAFNDIWESGDSGSDYPSRMLQGMRHVGLVPLIMESLMSREPVTPETVELQTLMLAELGFLFRCCAKDTPNTWPMHFSHVEAYLPGAFANLFELIEKRSHEDYILQLQIALLNTLGTMIQFLMMFDKTAQIIKRMEISKILDTLWGSSFAPSRSLGASTRNTLLLSSTPWIIMALDVSMPSWYTTYNPPSMNRAVARYRPEKITHRMREVCEDPETSTTDGNIKTVGILFGLIARNRSVAVEVLKAGLPKLFVGVYWTWLRRLKDDRDDEGAVARVTKLVFQTIHALLAGNFSTKTAEEESLLKRNVQDLVDSDLMLIMGRNLVVDQYEKDFMDDGLRDLADLFDGVFKQVYGVKCGDREMWHSFSHVLNCARAYCRVHGDPPVLRRQTIYGYRAVTYMWHRLGMSIGVREDIWWDEFVWGKLPLEVRKMGCSWMRCPYFGIDYMDLVTAGPTPLVCSKCRAAFYCSKECQKEDWNQGNHRRQCLGKGLSTTPSREGIVKRDP